MVKCIYVAYVTGVIISQSNNIYIEVGMLSEYGDVKCGHRSHRKHKCSINLLIK